MFWQRLRVRDRWTYGLAALAVVAFLVVNLLGLFRSSPGTSTKSLAAEWQTYGGSAAYRGGPCGMRACPQTNVRVYQDGTYSVTTLFHATNGSTSGQLSPAQAAELAQGRANPELPTSAPPDCGSYLFSRHVKILVVMTDGTSRTLDTCLADVPSSSPLVQLLRSLATSGSQAS